MRVRFTRIITWEYDVSLDCYPENSTIEKIMELDQLGAEEDPDLFFSSPDSDVIKLMEVE